MAVAKKTTASAKLTAVEAREKVDELQKKLDEFKTYGYCYLCDSHKSRDKFYYNSDPKSISHLSPICKTCARKIAVAIDENGNEQCKKEDLIEALFYLNKPFIESIWDSSVQESENLIAGKTKSTTYDAYIKNIAMQQWLTVTFRDSDHLKFNSNNTSEKLQKKDDQTFRTKNQEIIEQYKINQKDVIHSIGYDPFENYPIEEDKPILYAQLNSFIDDETKNDGMKMGAVIQIVKKLNQAEKLNDQIDKYISDTIHAADNMALIDKMAGSSKKLMDVANALAKDNGLSVNFNNNKSKGANTLSGKFKKLVEIGLREGKINSFDVGTCQGMMQVAEISEAARHKQIGYDENIAQEIKDIKVELVEQLSKERDQAIEDSRKLLMENKDLKDFLLRKGLINENFEVIDDE